MIDINLTFFGELITFGVLVYIVRNFILPVMMAVLEERKRFINEQLAKAQSAEQVVNLAKQQAANIKQEADLIASRIIHDSKKHATQEHKKMLEKTNLQIQLQKKLADNKLQQDKMKLLADLKNQSWQIAMKAASDVLQKRVSKETQEELMSHIIDQL